MREEGREEERGVRRQRKVSGRERGRRRKGDIYIHIYIYINQRNIYTLHKLLYIDIHIYIYIYIFLPYIYSSSYVPTPKHRI